MKPILVVLLVLLTLHSAAGPAIQPAEGRRLHYRIVTFKNSQLAATDSFVLQIAEGYFNEPRSFAEHVVVETAGKGNTTIAEVPAFGKTYTWCMYKKKNGNNSRNDFFHFGTGSNPYTDTSSYRLQIVTAATTYENAYILLDAHGVMYDMKGNPVWYLPAIGPTDVIGADLRDLKVTPQHTITYIYKGIPTEIDWEGKVLWRAPDTGIDGRLPITDYHHECTRLNNGHYMVLGTEFCAAKDTTAPKIAYGTVLEYDAKGKIVWQWKSSGYYKTRQYHYERAPGEYYDVHENAFYLNEKTHYLYVGFKNVSQVLKITYPGGDVVAAYGTEYNKAGDAVERMVYEQHGITCTPDGYLGIFDNHNVDKSPALFQPRLLLLKEDGKKATPVWSFEFDHQTVAGPVRTTGGNLVVVDSNYLYASVCAPYSNLLLIGRDKHIAWEASPQRWDTEAQKWADYPQYRSAIITNRKQLELLIKH